MEGYQLLGKKLVLGVESVVVVVVVVAVVMVAVVVDSER
jgi:hypothetical protein